MLETPSKTPKVPKSKRYLNHFDLSILRRIFLGEPVSGIASSLGRSITSTYTRADQMKKELVRKYPTFIRYEPGYSNSHMLDYVNREIQIQP